MKSWLTLPFGCYLASFPDSSLPVSIPSSLSLVYHSFLSFHPPVGQGRMGERKGLTAGGE